MKFSLFSFHFLLSSFFSSLLSNLLSCTAFSSVKRERRVLTMVKKSIPCIFFNIISSLVIIDSVEALRVFLFTPKKRRGSALLTLFRTRKLNWLNYQRASHNDIDADGDKARAGIMKPLLCHHRSALSLSDDTIESLLTPSVKLIRVYSTSLIIFHIFPTFVLFKCQS